jgi:hypothetical protein
MIVGGNNKKIMKKEFLNEIEFRIENSIYMHDLLKSD